jgi:TPP-dependent indolepyruvate ferredoxin oxidoreductase alpha subunit
MTPPKKSTPKVEEVRPYVEGVAKNLVDKLYGPDGPAWGTSLTDIEDLLLALRAILTEKMLDEALARQAVAQTQAPATLLACPGCQQLPSYNDTSQRLVQTRAGEAEWAEPEGYCRSCRRSFFPSVQELRH